MQEAAGAAGNPERGAPAPRPKPGAPTSGQETRCYGATSPEGLGPRRSDKVDLRYPPSSALPDTFLRSPTPPTPSRAPSRQEPGAQTAVQKGRAGPAPPRPPPPGPGPAQGAPRTQSCFVLSHSDVIAGLTFAFGSSSASAQRLLLCLEPHPGWVRSLAAGFLEALSQGRGGGLLPRGLTGQEVTLEGIRPALSTW